MYFLKTFLHLVDHHCMFIPNVIIPLTQDGETPLYVASQNGHSDVVYILIRNGADINMACNVWRYNVPYTHTV